MRAMILSLHSPQTQKWPHGTKTCVVGASMQTMQHVGVKEAPESLGPVASGSVASADGSGDVLGVE